MIRNLGEYNHTFLGICPPTPSLSQHFTLSENKVLMLVQGRGRLAVSQKHIMIQYLWRIFSWAVSQKHIMIQYLWRIFSCCFPLSCATYVYGFLCHSFKILWRTVNSKPPTRPFGIVPCTFSDNLSRNSCVLQVVRPRAVLALRENNYIYLGAKQQAQTVSQINE